MPPRGGRQPTAAKAQCPPSPLLRRSCRPWLAALCWLDSGADSPLALDAAPHCQTEPGVLGVTLLQFVLNVDNAQDASPSDHASAANQRHPRTPRQRQASDHCTQTSATNEEAEDFRPE
mmetsp:Transcript_22843/g.51647  ORF Transcript_22843/g.51647 Transcript_22843/m.51647 type:complete len:119 (+) Transcript_22843:208-564(+)